MMMTSNLSKIKPQYNSIVVVRSPTKVPVTKTKFMSLNMNKYRTEPFRTLHKAKKTYTDLILLDLMDCGLIGSNLKPAVDLGNKISIGMIYYPATARIFDCSNLYAVQSKFFLDALVHYKLIPDDNYKYVEGHGEMFGEVDKNNPRVEIEILYNK